MTLVDAHVHVWDPARFEYAWLHGHEMLERAFLPGDVDRGRDVARGGDVARSGDGTWGADVVRGAARSGTGDGTAAMVFVQAGCRRDQGLAEAAWVAGLADAWPELRAIVADADLRSGAALDTHLDALAALGAEGLGANGLGANGLGAGNKSTEADAARVRVAGIRHLLQDEPLTRLTAPAEAAALVGGLRRLAERGLAFDLCVRHAQLHAAADLMEQVPALPFVLDHLGKPPVDDGIDSAAGRAWASAIERISALPSAHVKLSGLAAEASTPAALDAHAREFLMYAIRAFGPERSMIGSDWPVSALTGAGGTFASWRERVRQAASAAGVDDPGLAAIEGGAATAFYGLPSRPR